MEVVIVCSMGAIAIGELVGFELEVEEIRREFEAELTVADLITFDEVGEEWEEEKEEYPRHEVKVMRSQVIIRKPKHIRARTTC
ncbi:hypothetical protein [Bacillus toyonensis]|uniref:hypothetical protein n=1 Tax=Bacillus toyonensis TaxID=155322 RepID=UPI000BFDF4CE|nr:hypothetical protein [Bacillus toyonensis]PHD85495.1 hypothetical protein COF55_25190 [Bacillus toyonensis]